MRTPCILSSKSNKRDPFQVNFRGPQAMIVILRLILHLKGLPLEIRPPPILLQICPKLCYFIHEYACLLPDRSAISDLPHIWYLPKTLLFHWQIWMFKAWYTSQFWGISKNTYTPGGLLLHRHSAPQALNFKACHQGNLNAYFLSYCLIFMPAMSGIKMDQ